MFPQTPEMFFIQCARLAQSKANNTDDNRGLYQHSTQEKQVKPVIFVVLGGTLAKLDYIISQIIHR